MTPFLARSGYLETIAGSVMFPTYSPDVPFISYKGCDPLNDESIFFTSEALIVVLGA